MNVCVYGGGNIAHSIAAKISLTQPLTVITRQPARWNRRISFEQDGKVFESLFDVVATDDLGTAAAADLVFVALPQFAIEETVDRLSRVLKRSVTLVLVPAPAMSVDVMRQMSSTGVNVVGFQRVPYISRIVEYGRRVRISSDRRVHRVAFSALSQVAALENEFTRWFGGDVVRLSSFLTFVFNNSNPLLHPSRMVVLFRNWRARIYPVNPPFYAEWTDESSDLYVAADREMLSVMRAVDPTGACENDYESVLAHYDVLSAAGLTNKLRSIVSFKSILSPMKESGSGWVPDFGSRYFVEDVDIGLTAIVRYANMAHVDTPVLNRLLGECGNMIRRA